MFSPRNVTLPHHIQVLPFQGIQQTNWCIGHHTSPAASVGRRKKTRPLPPTDTLLYVKGMDEVALH